MAPQYPRQFISLKSGKCPQCGDRFGRPSLKEEELTVKAVCEKDGCDFAVDLFWLGDVDARSN